MSEKEQRLQTKQEGLQQHWKDTHSRLVQLQRMLLKSIDSRPVDKIWLEDEIKEKQSELKGLEVEIDFIESALAELASNSRKPSFTEPTQSDASRKVSKELKLLLRKNLESYFDVGELHGLCFDLEIAYENIPRKTKQELVISLIDYCIRHGLVFELLEKCKKLRPHVSWHYNLEENK